MDACGENLSFAKGLDHAVAHLLAVLGIELEIQRDQGAQEIAEGHIHWRHIVEGAEAHAQEALGELRRLGGQPVDQIGCKRPRGSSPDPPVAMRMRSAMRFWNARE